MKRILLLCIIGTMLFSGCIQTPEPDVPKRVAVVYNVENVGSDIVVGQDTINVEVVKLLADKINFSFLDNRVLQTQPDALVMTYRDIFEGEDETILSANIGIDDFQGFKSLKIFVDTPQDGDDIVDNDFFGDPNNFSFIITGSYNNKNFTYRSGPVFEKNFPFASNIELNNDNETLLTRVSYNMRDILVDAEANRILDPDNPDNSAIIDSLLQESLNIEASAINTL